MSLVGLYRNDGKGREAIIVYLCNIGIMEKKMETTIDGWVEDGTWVTITDFVKAWLARQYAGHFK